MGPASFRIVLFVLLLGFLTGCEQALFEGSGGGEGEAAGAQEGALPEEPRALPGDLVGHWRFEEDTGTAYDDTRFGNHGSIQGAERCDAFSGQGLRFHGGGLHFDGDAVVVSPTASLDLQGPFYVEAMIRVTGTDRYYAVADKYRYVGEGHEEGFSFYLVEGRLSLRTGSGVCGSCEVTGTSDLRDEAWHHVQGVWDGEKIAVLVDGRAEAATRWTHGPASTPNALGLGKRLSGWVGTMPFEGEMDSIEIGLR
ncbi:MAG: LamG-like jellyroll fold domain-containing protein, partial [Planctomycetota bacterium]